MLLRSRVRAPPAVDGHGRSINEARPVREQVRDGGRHLFGTPYPADRMQEAHLLFDPRNCRWLLPGEKLLVAFGGDRAECYGVDPDTLRPIFDCQRACQPFDGRLSRRVSHSSPDRPLRLVRGDIDYRPARASR